MKASTISLFLLFIAQVTALNSPRFVVKSRTMTSLETITGVPMPLPLPKSKLQQDEAKSQGKTAQSVDSNLAFLKRGLERDYDNDFWNHPHIHTLGNAGILGAVHAALAPISTKMIDMLAYDGVDIRAKVAQELSECVTKNKARVLDMCCGVGISTRALRQAFPEAEAVIGLDTSPQMVAMANFLNRHLAIVSPLFQPVLKRLDTSFALLEEQRSMLQAGHRCRGVHFRKGNAQDTRLPNQSFDLVTVMYAFHEAPREGRDRIIKEARRLLSPGGVLAIVDISADYEPSETMLAGEPYVLEYQQNIRDQLLHMKGFVSPKYKTLVPGRVDMWTLRRSWT